MVGAGVGAGVGGGVGGDVGGGVGAGAGAAAGAGGAGVFGAPFCVATGLWTEQRSGHTRASKHSTYARGM